MFKRVSVLSDLQARTSTSNPSHTCNSRRRNVVVRDINSWEAEKCAGVGYGRYLVNALEATCCGKLKTRGRHSVKVSSIYLSVHVVPVDPPPHLY